MMLMLFEMFSVDNKIDWKETQCKMNLVDRQQAKDTSIYLNTHLLQWIRENLTG